MAKSIIFQPNKALKNTLEKIKLKRIDKSKLLLQVRFFYRLLAISPLYYNKGFQLNWRNKTLYDT